MTKNLELQNARKPEANLVFGLFVFGFLILCAIIGLIWLATIPLTSGLVALFFGTKWMSMLYGFVFLSHQVGSFLGVWLGGRLFDGSSLFQVGSLRSSRPASR